MDEKHNFTFFGVSIKKNQIKCLGWQHLNVTNSTKNGIFFTFFSERKKDSKTKIKQRWLEKHNRPLPTNLPTNKQTNK